MRSNGTATVYIIGELDVKHGDLTVHKYGQGESFGESSLLMEKPRS